MRSRLCIFWFVAAVVIPHTAAFCDNDKSVVVHMILSGRDPLEALVATISNTKTTLGSVASGKIAIQSVSKLIQKDQVQAHEAFKALADSSLFGANLTYAASAYLNSLNYYAVDVQIPLSLFTTINGASSIFEMIDGVSSAAAELTKEERSAQKIVLSALNTVVGGAKLASIITGFTLPGGAIVLTATPIAVSVLMQYSPKVYQYYFTSFLRTESLKEIPKEKFDSQATFTYVQCHYKENTYWGKAFDESQTPGMFSQPNERGGAAWQHKVVDFKLRGTWLSLSDKSGSGFATRNSLRAILNACKLPLLLKEERIKKGRITEVRKLLKTISDDGITFEARDFGLIGKPYPVIFVNQLSKQVLSN